MRLLVDARPFVDSTGGVARVARELVSAFIEHATDMETVLATTGAKRQNLFSMCHPRERGDLSDVRMDSRFHGNDKRATHCHLSIPNKLWSSACLINAVSFNREVAKRTGKIDAIFLPNLGFVGNIHRPYVLLLHDLSFLIEPQWFSPRMRLWHRAVRAKQLIQNASHLLAVSETTKRDAMRLLNIPEERITVIPIGSTLSAPPVGAPLAGALNDVGPGNRAGTRPAPTEKRFVLAFAGNARKNSSTAIAAIAELRRDPQFADVELILMGANGLHPSDSDLASLYANASALLYPSWYEGYGLPLHEAASFGTPCIASTAGALPETTPPGTLFADPAKPSHWIEALRLTLCVPRPTPISPDPHAWINASKMLENCLKSLKTD